MKKFYLFLNLFIILILTGCTITDASANTNIDLNNAPLKIHYIDVGQADSIFIELPNSETMLIDGGNNEDGDLVVNYIKNLNYDKINYLIGTHPHEDHIGGLDDVINSFDISSIYLPKISEKNTPTTKTYESLLTAIKNKNLKINTAKSGKSIIASEDLNIYFLAPTDDYYEDLNNYSAVVMLKFKDNSFLFTGDAEELSENEITGNIKADVLKVGHHGSSTSTSKNFLEKVNPQFAVISVGKDNSYGHPHDTTIKKLNSNGITILRTDELGTINFYSDGENISYDSSNQALSDKTENLNLDYVYVTNSGKKYHTGTCSYLGKNYKKILLSEARKNYEPCSKCIP